jgi:Fe-S oxidoreductase
MKRSRANGLCCGAGAQMFKDAEPGNKEINVERTEDADARNNAADVPFCTVDRIKTKQGM